MKKIFFVLCMFFSIASVSANDNIDLDNSYLINVCETEALITFRIIGVVLVVIKILIPLIIIIFASISLGKAVLSGDDKDMKTAMGSLVKRFIAGIIIFFIPTIINVVINMVDGIDEVESKFSDCNECIFNPNGEECETKVKIVEKCSAVPDSEDCSEYWRLN